MAVKVKVPQKDGEVVLSYHDGRKPVTYNVVDGAVSAKNAEEAAELVARIPGAEYATKKDEPA